MLKVGIVGCGKIADIHASQIRRIPACEIVGVCDNEELMARQLAERLSVRNSFGEVGDMLKTCNPDVVHVTTPPQSHFDIATLCLEHGSHVYVEKPFTLHAWEAEELIARANSKGLKVTAGHDAQFSHATRRMRQLIHGGYLGGPPVHMESLWCYQLGAQAYAQAFLGGKGHWVRRLPGGLLQNIISHGISKIAEFLTTDSPDVLARGFVSAHLQSLGEHKIVDELRVVISEDERTTAYFTFSSQMRPSLHQFRIFGPINGLLLDEDQQFVLKLRGARYKSYLERFVPPLQFAGQHVENFCRNLSLFLKRDFHMEAGMKCLIEALYSSIALRREVPIPYREIVLTARIMENIFQQLNSHRSLTESNVCTLDSV